MDYSIFVGNLHSRAYQLIKKNYGKLLLMVLIVMAIQYASNTLMRMLTVPASVGSTFSPFNFHMSFDMNQGFQWQRPMRYMPYYNISSLLTLGVLGALEPLMMGRRLYMIGLIQGQSPRVEQLFMTFKKFLRYVGCYFWIMLWVFLWTLLLIVPGIIKGYAYSMTPYLVAQYDDLSIRDAMHISKRITYGYKGKIFLMHLALFGWAMLSLASVITLCLAPLVIVAYAFLWLMPLGFSLEALMYLRIKEVAFHKGILSGEDLKAFAQPTVQ